MCAAADPEKATRVRNAWGQGDRLRSEILTAAADLLGALGTVDGLTLRAVARHVGIAPASIYAHFPDKSGLVDALVVHEYGRIFELMWRAEQDDRYHDAPARLRAQLQALCRYSMGSPGLYRLLFGAHPRLASEDRRASAAVLVERLANGLMACERGDTRLRLPAERAAIVLVVGVHGRVAISHARGELDAETQVFDFVDDLLSLVFETSATPDR
jgi:AcrR family transcriptional regulator